MSVAAWLTKNMSIYLNPKTPITGIPNSVTGIQDEGTFGFTSGIQELGTDIIRSEDGFRFNLGDYLRNSSVTGTFRGALILADVTVHSQPSGTGYILWLDTTVESRVWLKVATTAAVSGTGPSSNVASLANSPAFGVRQTVGFLVDPEQVAGVGGPQAMIARDGYIEVDPTPGTFADIVLDDVRIGSGGDMTIHELAVVLIEPSGSLPAPVYDLWCKLSGATPRKFSQTNVELFLAVGQSQPIGPSITPTERLTYNFETPNLRAGVKMLDGLQNSNSAALGILGPQGDTYNATASTGVIPAALNNDLTTAFMVPVELNTRRGNGSPEIWTGFHGQAGQPISNFQNGTNIAANIARWANEAASQLTSLSQTGTKLVILFHQGEANASDAVGVWKTGFETALATWTTSINTALPGLPLEVHLVQVAGNGNTSATDWHVCQDQLDWASQNSRVLIPSYPYEVQADGVHFTLSAKEELDAVSAWALTVGAAGWNVPVPTTAVVGNTLTLTFTLPAGHSLVAHDALKYNGEGVSHYGVEVTGASIVSSSLSGSVVTIECDTPPATVRYAMQNTDLTTRVAPNTAHRGELRTDMIGSFKGQPIYHWIPSFEVTV